MPDGSERSQSPKGLLFDYPDREAAESREEEDDDEETSGTLKEPDSPSIIAESTAVPHRPAGHSHDSMPESRATSMVGLLLKKSVLASTVKLILAASLFLLPGVILYGRYRQRFTVGPFAAEALCLFAAFSLAGYAAIRLVIHLLVLLCHARGWSASSRTVFYLTELESYVAAGMWIVGQLVVCNTTSGLGDLVAGDVDLRKVASKLLVCMLTATAMLAVKRHLMTSLAMSFNYSNYRERIQRGLMVDRVTRNIVHSARTAYKARKRAARPRGSEFGWSSVQSAFGDRSPSTVRVRRSSVDASIPRQSAAAVELTPAGFLLSHPTSPTSPMSHTSHTGQTGQSHQQQSHGHNQQHTPTAPTHMPLEMPSDAEKKRQFAQFARLANRLTSQFDDSSIDYRIQLAREAQRQAARFFKWLKPADGRDYLIPADLQRYVENEKDLCDFIDIVGRKQTGAAQPSPKTASPLYALGWTGGRNTPRPRHHHHHTSPLNISADANSQLIVITEGDLRRGLEWTMHELYGLSKSMQSIETALRKIDRLFTCLVLLASLIIVAVAIGDAVQLLLALSTMLSGAAFVFGTSAKNTFESIIFLLVIHPFDVGDRVYVQLGTAATDPIDNLVVAEMHLLSTIFERWDGVRVYVANHILAYKAIYNIRRSGPILEIQRVQLDYSTPVAKIERLRWMLAEFVARESADFVPDISRVNLDTLDAGGNRVWVNVVVRHAGNFQDYDVQLARRSKLLAFVRQSLDELGISYMPPVQRIALLQPEDLHALEDGQRRGRRKICTPAEALLLSGRTDR